MELLFLPDEAVLYWTEEWNLLKEMTNRQEITGRFLECKIHDATLRPLLQNVHAL